MGKDEGALVKMGEDWVVDETVALVAQQSLHSFGDTSLYMLCLLA